MLDIKEATIEEKITHYLLNELDEEQSQMVKEEINNNVEHQKILKETKILLDLFDSDAKETSSPIELGVDRKSKIMSEAVEDSPSRVLQLFKHMRFTIAIAAALILSVILFPDMWKDDSAITKGNTSVSDVEGVYSFTTSLPSGDYSLTFQEGKLAITNIKDSDGEDFFSKAKILKGDVILEINNKDTSRFISSQWKEFFAELINEKEVIIKIERDGTVIVKKVAN